MFHIPLTLLPPSSFLLRLPFPTSCPRRGWDTPPMGGWSPHVRRCLKEGPRNAGPGETEKQRLPCLPHSPGTLGVPSGHRVLAGWRPGSGIWRGQGTPSISRHFLHCVISRTRHHAREQSQGRADHAALSPTRFLSHDLHGPAPGHARTQGRSDFRAARPAPSGRGRNPELDSQTSSPAATAARPSRCHPLPGLIVPLLSGCQDSAWHLLVTNIRKQDCLKTPR